MKKQVNIFCAVLFIAIIFNSLNAQTIAFHPSSTTANQIATATFVNEEISDNVQKKFKKNFPGITGESWGKTDNGYMVLFTVDNVQTRVFLNRKGNVKFQIRYYSEAHLPDDIRTRVKSVYYDYNIFSVQEVNLIRTKFYLVSLEDKNTWKIIRINDDDMEIYKEYAKR
jgi:ribosomal protein L21E